MNCIRQKTRRGPNALFLLVLVALAALATAGFAESARVGKKGAQGSAARGRIKSPPMTMIQGVLSGGSGNGWNVADRVVRFERDCTLVDQASPDGTSGPRSGVQVVLMGHQRQGVFVAYSGMIFPEAYQEQPLSATAKEHVRWSETDPTVGEADDSVPK